MIEKTIEAKCKYAGVRKNCLISVSRSSRRKEYVYISCRMENANMRAKKSHLTRGKERSNIKV